jgi:hypothetical protein
MAGMNSTGSPQADIGILGSCSCGSGPAAPNYECERCRLVYAVLLMRDVRAAQVDYFHDRCQQNLVAAKSLESKMDRLLDRLLAPPSDQQPDLDMPVDSGDSYYGSGS